MHAWIHSNIMSTFDDKLQVGKTYEITNFDVSLFTGKYKCLKGDKHIIITNVTRVSEIHLSQRLLHEEIFDFTHFYELGFRNFQDTHCIGINFNLKFGHNLYIM